MNNCHRQLQQFLLEEKILRILEPVWTISTQLEYVAQPGVWISEIVEADIVWHVVAVEPFAKVGESDGVLDEGRMIL